MATKTTNDRPLCPKCKKRRMYTAGKKLIQRAGRSERVTVWRCRDGGGDREICYQTIDPTAPYRDTSRRTKRQKDMKPRKKYRRKIDTSKWMVFTGAQNSTPVHEGFFAALKEFCADNDAELCVIPMRYKNPTSTFSASQRNEEHWLRDVAEAELAEDNINSWNFREKSGVLFKKHDLILGEFPSWKRDVLDKYVSKYLYEQRRKLNDNLVVVGDVKVQPTRDDPLSTFTSMTHGESGIFGHTSLRLQCVPTPQNKLPKIITTTGACTQPNYTDSATGKTGEFHHVLGAVVVEIESPKKFHLYHINARSDGAFIFIDTEYHPDGTIQDADPSQALVFGDTHWRFVNAAVDRATFAPGGLVDVLDPPKLVWHDLLDCYWGNPHNVKNPFITIAKHKSDYHLARNEVEQTIAWMDDRGKGRENIVVPSNHDDMFARWIIREDWKDHADNAEFYLETALQMARSAKIADTGAQYVDPFGYWVEKLKKPESNVTVLRANEPYTVADIELGMHGDKGPKGARGTIKNFAKIGVKSMTGHGHSPAFYHGHTRVGTMITDAEYLQGPGDWLPAHGAIDAFGKRHLHFCIDGNFGFGITPE